MSWNMRKVLTADSEEGIEKEISDYFKLYPPAGYGTTLEKKWHAVTGKWHAIVNRYPTCD